MEESQTNGVAIAEAAAAGTEQRPVDPEIMAKLSAIRTRIQTSVGEVVLAMNNLPRYRHQAIADIQHLVLHPLMHDRIAIAKSKTENEIEATAGIAIWASVSDEVDARLREQIKGGVFPVRLQAQDWVSGETIWLLDVIAPTRKLATSVLANFKQIVQDKPIRIHPVVARAVDPDVLEKMRVKPHGVSEVPASEA